MTSIFKEHPPKRRARWRKEIHLVSSVSALRSDRVEIPPPQLLGSQPCFDL